MSSSRPAQKIFSTISTLQKLGLQNKPACEKPKNKYLSWLSLRWPGSKEETADEQGDKFNSTGIVADSIFLKGSMESRFLRQEKLITSDSSCPGENMEKRQLPQLHPKITDLDHKKSKRPIASKKRPIIEAKTSFHRLETSSNNLQASATAKYSGVKLNPRSGSECFKGQPYTTKPDTDAYMKNKKTEGASGLRGQSTYYNIKNQTPFTLAAPFKTGMLKTPREKVGGSVVWLKSKSLNECKKTLGKCNPNIKLFKNAVPSTPSSMVCPSTPMTPRTTDSPLGAIFNTHRRFYSNKKEGDKQKDAKPEECTPDEEEAKEPKDVVETNRCAKAKCGPASVECPKPQQQSNQHRCPKKPAPKGRTKKKVKKADPKNPK